MSAQEILAKHAERITARQQDLNGRLQDFFARNPDAKAWADDLKSAFGEGVRMKWFRDDSDDSRK